MKRWILPLTAALLLLCAGCDARAGSASASDGGASLSAPGQEEHAHAAPAGDNVVPHEPGGYCGNTVTTVRALPREGREGWEISFWGSDSVTVTDLLRFLDYGDEVCRCPAEYTVDTEFGGGYAVNLTRGFARLGDGQTQLTVEQLDTLRRILTAAEEGALPPVCGYPPAEP